MSTLGMKGEYSLLFFFPKYHHLLLGDGKSGRHFSNLNLILGRNHVLHARITEPANF